MKKFHGIYDRELMPSLVNNLSDDLEDEKMFSQWKLELKKELPSFWESMKDNKFKI